MAQQRDIVVIGGSTGAIEALTALLQHLPPDLAAALFVTVHVPNDAPNLLPAVLRRAARLPVRSPIAEEKIETGTVYLAPPDFHLLIGDGTVTISDGPRENRHRPAIDPLFRSAARAYGKRVVGVVLSGQLDDGAFGLMAIKMRGGLAVVQDPAEALCPEMPRVAGDYVGADHVLPVAGIASLLARLAHAPADSAAEAAAVPNESNSPRALDDAKSSSGQTSAFACPECHGTLWEVERGKLLRFECRVGHAYTAASLEREMTDTTEAALWAALRALDEKAALLRRLSNRAGGQLQARYLDQVKGYERHSETLRRILKENADQNRAAVR